MKILAFIVALTVLGCSIIPCREISFALQDAERTNMQSSAAHTDQTGTDDCSPFCSCNCCCSITLLYSSYRIAEPIAVVSPKLVSHLPSDISDASLPVWQPPQLV